MKEVSEEVQLNQKIVQLKGEQTRLTKENDLLKVRYDNQKRALQEQYEQFIEKQRVDNDKIARQLADNKMREERLEKTQVEVNQLKLSIEKSLQEQKDLLLKKQVELDDALEAAKKERADLAKRLDAFETHKKERK